MKAILHGLQQSILNHDLPQLAQVVDQGQAQGMNYFDLLTTAESAVHGLDAEEWGELMNEIHDLLPGSATE